MFERIHARLTVATPDHSRNLYEHAISGSPPPGAYVAAIRFDPSDIRGHYRHNSLWPAETGIEGAPVAFIAAFNVLQVALPCSFRALDHPVEVTMEGPSVKQVQPSHGPIDWPPDYFMGIEGLAAVAASFIAN